VLKKIFGPKREEVTGDWKKLHSEKLHGLYPSPNIIRVLTSRRMRYAGHMALVGGRDVYTGFWYEN
jgi:hypothetical protein